LSDLFKPEDDQQNTSDNSQEIFNSGGSSPSPSLSDSVLSETSLPEFTGEEALDVPRVRSSEAAPLGLNELLSVPRAEAESKAKAQDSTFATRPSYKVSPATSDLSNYPVPGLEDESPDEVEVEKSSGWKTTWAIIREVGETVILTLIIFLIIQMVVRNFRVVGTSMVNNLQDGQYLIIDKISYTPWVSDYLGMGGPQRGDVIVFEPPRRPDEDYVKRIIALPGEKVQVIKGEVYINDQLVEEPFAPNPASYTMPKPVIVPPGRSICSGR